MSNFIDFYVLTIQAGIRTNTTVCLGKIAQHLHPQIRQRVLVSAFIRAMRDTFPPTRQAGKSAFCVLSFPVMQMVPHRWEFTFLQES